jgi:hypothetical protein
MHYSWSFPQLTEQVSSVLVSCLDFYSMHNFLDLKSTNVYQRTTAMIMLLHLQIVI